jgi:predicted MFS family arabinose efflux permease
VIRIDSRTLTVAACAVCTAVVMGVYLAFPIWAPAWISDFGRRRGDVMLIFSVSGILMSVTMPVVGRLLATMPAWRLIVVGALIMGGGAALASALTDYLAVAVVYGVAMGAGAALAGLIPCQTLAVRLFPQHVGAIGGLLTIATALSVAAMPQVLIPLKAAIGWRQALAATGGAVVVFVPLLAFVALRVGADPDEAAGAHGSSGAEISTRDILGSGAFWIILVGAIPFIALPAAIQANLLPLLGDHGVAQADAGAVFPALGIGTIVGSLLFGWLGDRFDPRPVMFGATVWLAGALVTLAFCRGVGPTAFAVGAIGAAGAGIVPLLSVFILRCFQSGFAPALGLFNFFILPYTLASPLLGYVRDQTGSYSAVLFAAAPIVVLAAAGMWSLKAAAKAPVGDALAAAPAE